MSFTVLVIVAAYVNLPASLSVNCQR